MDKNNLDAAIIKTLEDLQQVMVPFSEDQFNVIPFKDSWTAGQLVKHLIMSGSGFNQMVNGPVKETRRAPDEMVEKIKTTFLDLTTKLKSPDFIVPPVDNFDKDELTGTINEIKSGLDNAIRTLDLTQTCTAFEIPVLGFLTRLEAIYFVLYHTQRHIHQLKKIQEAVIKN